MLYLQDDDGIIFLCSPYITALDDLYRKGFSLADIPLYDAKRDFIMASEAFALGHQNFQQLEELTQRLQKTTKLIKEEKEKTDK